MADSLIQRTLADSLYKNLTTSTLVKTGQGVLRGFHVASTTGGTLQFIDGITNNDDVADKATATLTMSGAIVPAKHAVTTLTTDNTEISDGETVTIGATTYRFKDTMAQIYDVKRHGTTADTTLGNLVKAINGTGTAGVEYYTGTVFHADVVASDVSSHVVTLTARTVGDATFTTNINARATTETTSHLSFPDTTLGGGTGASDPAVADTAAKVTIGSRTYTFVNELSETAGATAVVDEVLWGGDTATALDNFKLAINAGATAGTNYSTGTVVNALVTAETNTDTTQVVQAITGGLAGNAITVSETLTNGTWGVAVANLSGGLEANSTILESFAYTAGTVVNLPNIMFETGLYVRTTNTIEATVFYY